MLCAGGGFRVSHHLHEFNYYNYPNKSLGFYSSFIVNGRSSSQINCVHSNSSHYSSRLLAQSLRSQCEDGLEKMSAIAGGIVALGKFDALHIGHRELAIQASKMGFPYLLSFVGMAEVLNWEPRAPIVAKCDRKRVLSTWSSFCNGTSPKEFEVEFLKVRSLTPRQFVEKLSKELGVRGVVAGQNYRFGYRASGNASDLVKLSMEYGMEACIINSVMDKNQVNSRIIDIGKDSKEQGQVSSTRVRYALINGDMKYVSQLLGRPHRLILNTNNDKKCLISSRNRVSVPVSCLLNLPPKEGVYDECLLFIDDNNVSPCRVIVEKMLIHLELDGPNICTRVTSQDTRLLGIEFYV